jgi:hypothetical protein
MKKYMLGASTSFAFLFGFMWVNLVGTGDLAGMWIAGLLSLAWIVVAACNLVDAVEEFNEKYEDPKIERKHDLTWCSKTGLATGLELRECYSKHFIACPYCNVVLKDKMGSPDRRGLDATEALKEQDAHEKESWNWRDPVLGTAFARGQIGDYWCSPLFPRLRIRHTMESTIIEEVSMSGLGWLRKRSFFDTPKDRGDGGIGVGFRLDMAIKYVSQHLRSYRE